MRLSDERFGLAISLPGTIIVALWVIVPLAILITVSLLRYDNMSPIVFRGLANYRHVLTSRVFWLSFRNTMVFSFGVTLGCLFFSMLLAHSINRIRKGTTFWRTMMMLPWAVPMVVSGFMWKQMFDPSFGVINDLLLNVGIINTPIEVFGTPVMAMIAVIIADGWRRIPFMTIIILAGLQSIDPNLYEAARIDGADIIQTFRHVSVPLNIQPILIATIITYVFSFRTIDAIFSLTFGGPAKATYTFGFYILDEIYNFYEFGVAGTISALLTVILFTVAGFFIYLLLKE